MTRHRPLRASPSLSRCPGGRESAPGSCTAAGRTSRWQRGTGRCRPRMLEQWGHPGHPASLPAQFSAFPSRHPGKVGDRSVPLAGCLHSLPSAQPLPRSAAVPQMGLCSAPSRCRLFPWIPETAPPLLGHSLLPPPLRRSDEPNGLGRRKVPDKRVLAPRGIATVPMQIHGVITPGCREIRHYLVLDKPSQVIT